MLKKIHIKNYKCFKDFCFELDNQSTFITGANGIGKSTLFQVIHIIKQIVCNSDSNVEKIFKSQDFNDLNIPIDIDIVLEIQSVTYQYKFSVAYINSFKYTVINEELLIDGDTFFFKNKFGNVAFTDTCFDIATDELALPIVLLTQGRDNNVDIFAKWFSNMILFAPIQVKKFHNDKDDNNFFIQDGSNFCLWLKDIIRTEPSFYISLMELLKPIMPDLNKISFISDGNNKRTMKISFSNAQNKVTIDFENLSSGEKMIFILSAISCWAEYSNQLSFVFIDEPNNFIVDNDLFEMIIQNFVNKANENNVQLLITSNQQFKNVSTYCMVRENIYSPTTVKELNSI